LRERFGSVMNLIFIFLKKLCSI